MIRENEIVISVIRDPLFHPFVKLARDPLEGPSSQFSAKDLSQLSASRFTLIDSIAKLSSSLTRIFGSFLWEFPYQIDSTTNADAKFEISGIIFRTLHRTA